MKKRLLFLRDGTASTVLVAYLFIAGLVLLLGLMVYLTVSDVRGLVNGLFGG